MAGKIQIESEWKKYCFCRFTARRMNLRRTESTIISWDGSMNMIQVFKIVQNIHDISMNGLFEFSDTQTRSNSKKLKKPRTLETFRMNSFCVRTTNKWNSLPNDTVNSKTVLRFKTLYDRYIHNWRDLLANLLVSINIAYWASTVRLYMYTNITTAFLRRTPPAENYTFSQKPTAHWIEKTVTPPPPTQKYSALPSSKNQKWDPLRAMKTFIRKKVGHTT